MSLKSVAALFCLVTAAYMALPASATPSTNIIHPLETPHQLPHGEAAVARDTDKIARGVVLVKRSYSTRKNSLDRRHSSFSDSTTASIRQANYLNDFKILRREWEAGKLTPTNMMVFPEGREPKLTEIKGSWEQIFYPNISKKWSKYFRWQVNNLNLRADEGMVYQDQSGKQGYVELADGILEDLRHWAVVTPPSVPTPSREHGSSYEWATYRFWKIQVADLEAAFKALDTSTRKYAKVNLHSKQVVLPTITVYENGETPLPKKSLRSMWPLTYLNKPSPPDASMA